MNGSGIDAYRQINVTTANPRRLVLMCYEGAIISLKTAREKHISGDYETRAETVQKAQSIISELMQALDFEKGGEVARNLNSLYNYMLRRIIEGDVKKDVRAFDEIIGMLSELKSAWEEIFRAPEGFRFIQDTYQEKSADSRVAGAY